MNGEEHWLVADLKYENVKALTRNELVAQLESDDPESVANALYSATRHSQDLAWVQEQCLEKLNSSEIPVRWAAATCLGDLAFWRRFQGNVGVVISALEFATHDPEIADPARFSLSLVNQATPKEVR
jgi:hypothetical protein